MSDSPIQLDDAESLAAQMPASATKPAKGRAAPPAPDAPAPKPASNEPAPKAPEATTEQAAVVDQADELASLDFDIDAPGKG